MLTKHGQILQTIASSLFLFVWGMLYSFPIYFPDIKDNFNYSQEELNLIGSGIYLGAALGIGFSPLTIKLLKHIGGIIFCLTISFFSYFMIFLAYKKEISSPVWSMIIYTMFLGWSCNLSFIIFIALLMIILDSPNYKNFIQTIYSSVFALGGSAATLVYIFFINKKVEEFLKFIIIAHAAIGGITTLILFVNSKYFAVHEEIENLSDDYEIQTKENLVETVTMNDSLGFLGILRELVRDTFFWIIFIIYILGSGIGTSYSTNLGNMTISFIGIDYLPLSSILFSICQTSGRLLVTLFSHPSIHLSQPKMLIVISTIYLVFFTIMFISDISFILFITFTIIVGIMYGAFWSVYFSVVNHIKVFKVEYFSNILAISMAPSQTIGTLTYNFLTGYIYDANADPNSHECLGKKCYETSFFIVSITSLIMLTYSMLLTIKRRKYVASIQI